ncbi:glycosyltransferase [Flaviramulus sp. BrNp1-15]|uniref:glycosyltransferase family 4 protein n=1 Tax=Flaviramulus sp. BrNp1-15 TaxID=2916754 RepID=UPI001EE83F7A|nr:glycosyltransferase [Flaviramulus sp. BrNp1-15]ULC60584.1 glycosyltransferase [Flaviramulus sp. BrNp1-15]
MKFLIITHVKHKFESNNILAYAPYVREMNIWFKYVDEVTIVAPKTSEKSSPIDLEYKHPKIQFKEIPSLEFTSIKKAFLSFLKTPYIFFVIFNAFRKTNHIHLRCPGNIGLIGSFIQVLFPKTLKTAKYAGNWDPKAKQPLSYRLQKKILSNNFLTKNIQVLVYGDWKKQTKNIKSFFTATFTNNEKELPEIRSYNENLKFIFVGSLVEGKRPLLAIKIIEALHKKGISLQLDFYGEGKLIQELQQYIIGNKLVDIIAFKGNKNKEVLIQALKEGHFLILPSKSEGWPKAIAEAMFFGVIPISTSISCIPSMLDYGNRGILIEPNVEEASNKILTCLNKKEELIEMSKLASKWSQNYTLDSFEVEISKLLRF